MKMEFIVLVLSMTTFILSAKLSSGVNVHQESECAALEGQCVVQTGDCCERSTDYKDQCPAQPAYVKCCVTLATPGAYHEYECGRLGGVCMDMNISSPCCTTNNFEIGACPLQENHIRCCLPHMPVIPDVSTTSVSISAVSPEVMISIYVLAPVLFICAIIMSLLIYCKRRKAKYINQPFAGVSVNRMSNQRKAAAEPWYVQAHEHRYPSLQRRNYQLQQQILRLQRLEASDLENQKLQAWENEDNVYATIDSLYI